MPTPSEPPSCTWTWPSCHIVALALRYDARRDRVRRREQRARGADGRARRARAGHGRIEVPVAGAFPVRTRAGPPLSLSVSRNGQAQAGAGRCSPATSAVAWRTSVIETVTRSRPPRPPAYRDSRHGLEPHEPARVRACAVRVRRSHRHVRRRLRRRVARPNASGGPWVRFGEAHALKVGTSGDAQRSRALRTARTRPCRRRCRRSGGSRSRRCSRIE